jgi:hypothetical protein
VVATGRPAELGEARLCGLAQEVREGEANAATRSIWHEDELLRWFAPADGGSTAAARGRRKRMAVGSRLFRRG